jgi:hypothetical protein
MVVLCALLATGASAQIPLTASTQIATDGSTQVLWQHVFATAGDDWINDIVPMKDGSFTAVGFLDRVGTSSDWRALAARFSESGEVLSTREYGAGGGVDAFWSMHEASDGKLAYAGFTTRMGGGGIDAWSMVTHQDGRILKENSYGIGAGYDRFIDLAPAPDGGNVFVGHVQPAGSPDVRYLFIVKTDANGIEQWRRTRSGPQSDPALYIEPSGDGGFIIAGGLEDDLMVMKIDAEGNEVWRKTIGTPDLVDNNHGLVVLDDRRIVVVGYTASWGSRSNDILAAVLSPSGEVLNVEALGGADDDRAILARADEQGRVWITGYTKSAGAGGWDVIVTRLDRNGSFEGGVTTLGSDKDDNGTAIWPLSDGSLLIGGYSVTFGHGREDAFLARISAPDWRRPHSSFSRRKVGGRGS